ncbi:hypothetical protein J3F83DRAFT_557969 [Trichoderma novae-zelandiae]
MCSRIFASSCPFFPFCFLGDWMGDRGGKGRLVWMGSGIETTTAMCCVHVRKKQTKIKQERRGKYKSSSIYHMQRAACPLFLPSFRPRKMGAAIVHFLWNSPVASTVPHLQVKHLPFPHSPFTTSFSWDMANGSPRFVPFGADNAGYIHVCSMCVQDGTKEIGWRHGDDLHDIQVLRKRSARSRHVRTVRLLHAESVIIMAAWIVTLFLFGLGYIMDLHGF